MVHLPQEGLIRDRSRGAPGFSQEGGPNFRVLELELGTDTSTSTLNHQPTAWGLQGEKTCSPSSLQGSKEYEPLLAVKGQ